MLASGTTRWLFLAVFGASSLFPRSSAAAPPAAPVDLTWAAPQGCPDREAALTQLRTLLAHRSATDERPEARVEITRTDEGRFAVVMRTRAGDLVSERRFESVTCENGVRAAAFIIAMALDPVGVAEEASARTPVWHPEAAESVLPPVVSASPRFDLAVGLRVAGDAGSLPLPTVGAGLALDASYGRWLWELSGTLWVSRQALLGPAPGAGGEISLRTAAGRACFAPVSGRPSWYGCLGSEAGLTEGHGVGILHPLQSRDAWIAVFGGIAVRQELSRHLHLWTNIDVGVPVRIPSYFIDGYGEVHRPWAVLARGAMGIDLSFL